MEITFPEKCAPGAACSKADERPGLQVASIQLVTHPVTGKKAMYACTTDSHVAALIPVDGVRERKTPITLPRELTKIVKGGDTVTYEDEKFTLNGVTYSERIAVQPPTFDQLAPDVPKEVPDIPGRLAFNGYLLMKLQKALGCPQPTAKSPCPGGRGPIGLHIGNINRAFVAVPLGFSDDRFGLIMPVRWDGE